MTSKYHTTTTLGRSRLIVRNNVVFVNASDVKDAEIDRWIRAACEEFSARIRPYRNRFCRYNLDAPDSYGNVETLFSLSKGKRATRLPEDAPPYMNITQIQIVDWEVPDQINDWSQFNFALDTSDKRIGLPALTDARSIYKEFSRESNPYIYDGLDSLSASLLSEAILGQPQACGFDSEGMLWTYPIPEKNFVTGIEYIEDFEWGAFDAGDILPVPDIYVHGILYYGVPAYASLFTAGQSTVTPYRRLFDEFIEKTMREMKITPSPLSI